MHRYCVQAQSRLSSHYFLLWRRMIKQKRILLVAAVGGVDRHVIPRRLYPRLYIRSIDIQRQNPGLGPIILNPLNITNQSRLVVTLSLITPSPSQSNHIIEYVQQVAEPEALPSCSEQAKSTASKLSLLLLVIDQYLSNIVRRDD